MARPRKDGTAPKTVKAKAADVEKPVETVETTDVVAPVEEPVEKVEETQTTVEVIEPEVAEVAETDEVAADETPVVETSADDDADDETAAPVEETPAENTPTEEPTKDEKKDDAPKATKKKKVAINGIVQLNGATTIYRGPGVYPFAKINGVVSPLEDTDESGYTKVQCVISGSGACTGYVKL